ncbi:MAG: FAD-dependent oxidoreductase [Burkholderiaceae bacterium]|nr:FAD-dependent oxidoreductase [Burkholderiaceae bacterium]
MNPAAPDPRPLGRWLCEACGLVYDEARGDPDSGLAPGTRFEDIPEDWTCPVCGVGKADFRPIEPPSAGAARRPASGPNRASADSRTAGTGPDSRAVIIVGAGLAGWSSARALREAGYRGAITLVTACDATVYAKPALSVCGARGVSPEALAEQSGAQLAAELDVTLLARTWAIELDRAHRRLFTTRGTLRYRQLIIASGARARRIDLAGPGASRLFSVNDRHSYVLFRAAFDRAAAHARQAQCQVRLLIIGAGLVGCEFANDFAGLGAQVTLLDSAPWPISSRLDKVVGERLRDALAGQGVSFDGGVRLSHAGIPPAAAAGTEMGSEALDAVQAARVALDWTSSCGTPRNQVFDLGLMATGIEPETRLAHRAGLPVGRAIQVDAHTLTTSDPRVFALGDCAEIEGQPGCTIEPIHRQARTIAGEITGQRVPFESRAPVWVVKTPCLPLVIRPAAPGAGAPSGAACGTGQAPAETAQADAS